MGTGLLTFEGGAPCLASRSSQTPGDSRSVIIPEREGEWHLHSSKRAINTTIIKLEKMPCLSHSPNPPRPCGGGTNLQGCIPTVCHFGTEHHARDTKAAQSASVCACVRVGGVRSRGVHTPFVCMCRCVCVRACYRTAMRVHMRAQIGAATPSQLRSRSLGACSRPK
jgi:hypothetical protein